MWTFILAILAAIAKPLSALWSNKIEHNATPDAKRQKQSSQIDREIMRDDAESANRRVGDWLRKIQDRKQRPSDSKSKSGSNIHPGT